MRKAKFIILATVFIDVIGIGIIIPSLPIFLKDITKSSFEIGIIMSVYSICGFLFSPLIGNLSDKFGRRPVLLASLFGTAVGWFVFSIGTFWTAIFGRIIDGVTSGNISAAQGFVTDISENNKERTHNLGTMGAVFGTGFIIGPALGALLSGISLKMPFLVAGAMAFLNTIAAYFYLPETNKNIRGESKVVINPFSGIKRAFSQKPLNTLLIIWFFYAMAITNFHSLFALYTHLQYGFDPAKNGLILTLVGLTLAVNQGILLKHFWLKHWTQTKVQIMANIQMLIALCLILASNLWLMVLGIFIQSFAQPLLRVTSNSEVVGAAEKGYEGAALGVYQSLFFLASILTPLVGGWLIDVDLRLPWIMAAIYMAAAFGMLITHYRGIAKLEPAMNQVAAMEESDIK